MTTEIQTTETIEARLSAVAQAAVAKAEGLGGSATVHAADL